MIRSNHMQTCSSSHQGFLTSAQSASKGSTFYAYWLYTPQRPISHSPLRVCFQHCHSGNAPPFSAFHGTSSGSSGVATSVLSCSSSPQSPYPVPGTPCQRHSGHGSRGPASCRARQLDHRIVHMAAFLRSERVGSWHPDIMWRDVLRDHVDPELRYIRTGRSSRVLLASQPLSPLSKVSRCLIDPVHVCPLAHGPQINHTGHKRFMRSSAASGVAHAAFNTRS